MGMCFFQHLRLGKDLDFIVTDLGIEIVSI